MNDNEKGIKRREKIRKGRGENVEKGMGKVKRQKNNNIGKAN